MSIATEIQRLQLAKEDIKSAIIEKGGTVEDNATIDTYGNAIRGISGGENLLQYATSIKEIFQSAIFPNDYELVLNLPNISSGMQNALYNTKGIKKCVFVGNRNNISLDVSYLIRQSSIEVIDFTNFGQGGLKASVFSHAFRNCDKLIEILGELDFSECTSMIAVFDYSPNLKEVRFKKNTIKLNLNLWSNSQLSNESIQSIIDGLADLTGETTQTITFHADVKAKLTEEQIATITSKNWTLA